MMHLLLLFRLAVMAAGAWLGGWLAGHLYLRAVWRYLRRRTENQK